MPKLENKKYQNLGFISESGYDGHACVVMIGAPTHRVLEVAAAGGSRRHLRGARPQDRLRGLQLVRATRSSGGHAGLVGAPPPTQAELAAARWLPLGVLHSGHLLIIKSYLD